MTTHPQPAYHTEPHEADVNDVLTVGELSDRLQEAFQRGLSRDVAVVVGPPGHDWLQVLRGIGDPTADPVADECQDWLWFTLFTGAAADSRTTPEHSRPPTWEDFVESGAAE